VFFAADAASQGLVIGFGAAIITMLGLLLAAVYRMLDGIKDQLKDAREDLRREIGLSREVADRNLTALTDLARGLDRDIVEIKTRLQYERGPAPAPSPTAPTGGTAAPAPPQQTQSPPGARFSRSGAADLPSSPPERGS